MPIMDFERKLKTTLLGKTEPELKLQFHGK